MVKLWYIAIVEYVFMDLINFVATAREGLIVDGRCADGRLGPGGKFFTLPASVHLLVDRLGFFESLSGASIDSV